MTEFEPGDQIELRERFGKHRQAEIWRPGVYMGYDNINYCFVRLEDCNLCGVRHDMHRVLHHDVRPMPLLDKLARSTE